MLQENGRRREKESVSLIIDIKAAVSPAHLFRNPAKVRFEARKEIDIRS
jgi:hypothetical protein